MKSSQIALSAAFVFAGLVQARPSFGTTLLDKRQTETVTKEGCTPESDTRYSCDDGGWCELYDGQWECYNGERELQNPDGTAWIEPVTKAGCTLHLDHYDCDDGTFCEQEGNRWWCFDEQGLRQNPDGSAIEGATQEVASEEESASGSSCVIHGGHTHGDCGDVCDGLDTGPYDLDLHIASIFILLVVSVLGIGLPLVLSSRLTSPIFSWFFFVCRHFGTGIIISVAFVHLLYHAFVMFANECIGNLAFEPASPTIAMAAAIVTFLVDFFAMRFISKHRPAHSPALSDNSSGTSPIEKGLAAKPHSHGGHGHDIAQAVHGTDYSSDQAHFDVYLLEAGILFHSIMIGVTLGATGGTEWVPLLCAIVFHQFFEGLALGSRIALLVYGNAGKLRKLMLALAFGIITPIGISIGVAVHETYNVNGRAALISIGVLDSISAGILLYVGLVELLAHDWLHGELAAAKNSKVLIALASLFAGLIAMTVIGKWA